MFEHHKFVFNFRSIFLLLMVPFAATLPVESALASNELSFNKAIKLAQENDPWLKGNIYQQQSLESRSIAAGTLPDPKLTLALANLPSNGFDFQQEAMTQAKVGISQMFARGDSLAIKREQLKVESESYPYQRANRKAQVAVTVGSIWLDAFLSEQSIALIESNRALFEQLADVAEASYSSTLGKTRQQDIVRAQLELTRLEDRLDKLAQQQTKYQGMLSRWLTSLSQDSATQLSFLELALTQTLPQIDLQAHAQIYNAKWKKASEIAQHFSQHPAVLAIDKKVVASKTGIKLAEQKYQPEWGVSASYGYRDDDPLGNSRADLFSVGVSLDLPLFTENRQDKEVQSAVANAEAVKTEKVLLLRQFFGSYKSAKGRLLRLKERQALYNDKLLPQIQDQAEASLTAYTNDDGDFAEVVRSRIAVLNAQIDALALKVEEQKLHLELNYLFAGNQMPADKVGEK